MLDTFIEQVLYLSKQDKKTLYQKMIKLSEEVGELGEAILSKTYASGCEYKNKKTIDIIEEIGDVITISLSILSLIYNNDITEKQLQCIEQCWLRKLVKWESKIKAISNKELAKLHLWDIGTHNSEGKLTKEYGGDGKNIPDCDHREHMRCWFDEKSCDSCPIALQ